MEFANVDALFDEQVMVHRNERLLLLGIRKVFQAAGVRADEDGSLLLDEPASRGQVDPALSCSRNLSWSEPSLPQ
jgi:hypothetical protein